MKLIDIIKSPFSVGLLGLVMAAMAGLLLLASYFIWDTPAFDESMLRMEQLDLLESDVNAQLAEMQLNEAYAIFYLEYGLEADGDYSQMALDADEEVSALLADMQAAGYFDDELYMGEAIRVALDEFNNQRSLHRQRYAEVVASYSGEDPAATAALLESYQAENDALSQSLLGLIKVVNWSRQDLQSEFPAEANQRIMIIAGALTVLLLLAMLGYQRVAAMTQPLASLTNAIIAIGGGQYRGGLLAGLLNRPGAAGSCARALDQLAGGLTERNAGLIQQIDRLRQELYESRRRRLKIFRQDKEGSAPR